MHATFEGISMQFGAITALAGVPQVTCWQIGTC